MTDKRQTCIENLRRYSDEDHPDHGEWAIRNPKYGDGNLHGCLETIAEGLAILLEESTALDRCATCGKPIPPPRAAYTRFHEDGTTSDHHAACAKAQGWGK